MKRNDTRNSQITTARTAALGVAILLLLSMGATARADDWKFDITPYAWVTDIGLDASLGARPIVDTRIPASDLIAVLDTIFQGRFEVSHGSFGAMADVFDVALSDEVSGIALPKGGADLKSDVGMSILDFAGVYDPKADDQGLSFLFGTRLLNERATIDASLGLAAGTTVSETYVTDDWMVDGLAGVRFRKRVSHHWGYEIAADVSTGGTDYTWSVRPQVSYAFGKAGRYEVNAGYRRMVIDFQDDGSFDAQMTLSGALLGFRIRF
jgi:hypothetical protein